MASYQIGFGDVVRIEWNSSIRQFTFMNHFEELGDPEETHCLLMAVGTL
jgi:uncharacterized protein YkvS